MYDIDKVNKTLNCAEVAALEETQIRVKAAFYDLLDEALETLPSAEFNTDPSTMIEARAYSWNTTQPSNVFVSLNATAEFDEVMAVADNMDIQKIYKTFSKTWTRRGVEVIVKITVTAPMHPDYLQTLRDLGKIKVEKPYEPYRQPSREVVYCPIPGKGGDDIPF